jgi:SAM-dependent methyltransferase
MTSSGSISFDRASDYYDRTRALDPATMQRVVELLTSEIGSSRCLEIGVGTGRIAIPLATEGVDLTGIDLSANMLAKLVENRGDLTIPVLRADATRLPFHDGSFDLALAAHVLHLIPAWRTALDELLRVVRPGGRLLIDVGGFGEGPWREMQQIFIEAAGIVLSVSRPGPSTAEEVDAEMALRGFSVRNLPEIPGGLRERFSEVVSGLEQGIYSFSWSSDQEARTRGADAVRDWMGANGLRSEDVLELQFTIRWRAYDL